MPKILLTSLLVFISVLVLGQRWQFAAGPGAVLYKGDLLDWHLAPNAAQLEKMSPSVNFQVRYQQKNAFAYRAKFNFSSLSLYKVSIYFGRSVTDVEGVPKIISPENNIF